MLALLCRSPVSWRKVRQGSPVLNSEYVRDVPQRCVLAYSVCPEPLLPSQAMAIQTWKYRIRLLLLVIFCGSRHNVWGRHLYCCLTVQFLVGQRAEYESCHPTWLSLLSFLAPTAEIKDWMSTGDESCPENLRIRAAMLDACTPPSRVVLFSWVKKGITISAF